MTENVTFSVIFLVDNIFFLGCETVIGNTSLLSQFFIYFFCSPIAFFQQLWHMAT